MGFVEAVKTCFRKYVTFSGRASRPEYWYFVLFTVLGNVATSVADAAVFSVPLAQADPEFQSNGPLAAIFSLIIFLPALAAGWRRMHDSGRSGLYLIYPVIVAIGVFSFLGFLGGFENLAGGDVGNLLATAGGLVLAVSFFVLLISPLLVVWWLTRPSQPGQNMYGLAKNI